MKIDVKDRVILVGTNQKGTVVIKFNDGKYKILWDHDWKSGRTRVHDQQELVLVN